MFYINYKQENLVKIELDFAERFDVFNIFKDYIVDMANYIGGLICLSIDKAKIYTEIISLMKL